jgi:hypothetical protein
MLACGARISQIESDLAALPARLATGQADLLTSQSPAAHARVAELERLRTEGDATLVAERATHEQLQVRREELLAEQQEVGHLQPKLAQRLKEIHRQRGEALRDEHARTVQEAASRVADAREALAAAIEAERAATSRGKKATGSRVV